jgi:hypothetical protein
MRQTLFTPVSRTSLLRAAPPALSQVLLGAIQHGSQPVTLCSGTTKLFRHTFPLWTVQPGIQKCSLEPFHKVGHSI